MTDLVDHPGLHELGLRKRGAVTSTSGSPASTTRPSGTTQTSPVNRKPRSLAKSVTGQPKTAAKTAKSSSWHVEAFQEIQHVGQPGGDKKTPLLGQLPSKQTESRRLGQALTEIGQRHRDLIKVRDGSRFTIHHQQPAARVRPISPPSSLPHNSGQGRQDSRRRRKVPHWPRQMRDFCLHCRWMRRISVGY